MKKTAAAAGRKPQEPSVPYRMSVSHISRLRHSAKRKTPSWPWPPLRLVDRRYDLDTVTCPFSALRQGEFPAEHGARRAIGPRHEVREGRDQKRASG